MQINSDILDALDEYHERSLLMQENLYDKTRNDSDLENKINDDLIFNVPIYDMLDRRYASFCSLPEAIKKQDLDPKGNGLKFVLVKNIEDIDFISMLYLFRLCGSGINYIPKEHGFGNFWISNLMKYNGITNRHEWINYIPINKFSDNKGYMLPMISIGLRNFIIKYSLDLVDNVIEYINFGQKNIKDVVTFANNYLLKNGFKRQTFVLSAFAADLAEYYPKLVDQSSMINAGTNAKKCIKLIFGKCKEEKAIQFLCERYKSVPYSVEDSRLCDPIRYFSEYQSKHHIASNNGIIYSNNTLLKKRWNNQEYQNFKSLIQV